MILLALESSAELSSVAVWKDWNVLAHQIVESKFGHAERIIIQVEKAIKQAEIDLSEIDFFVGGRGPGSFTGIRTCLAAIAGFSIATEKPFYGINGLSALGFANYIRHKKESNLHEKMRIFAVSDTRRRSFYIQEFNKDYTSSDIIHDFSLEKLKNKVSSLSKSGYSVNISGPFSKSFWQKNVNIPTQFTVKYDRVNLDATHIANYAAWQIENERTVSPATPLYVTPVAIFNSNTKNSRI